VLFLRSICNVCIYVCSMRAYIHKCMLVHICVCMYMRIYLYLYVNMHACECVKSYIRFVYAWMILAVFWVVAPCCLVEVCRRFRGACCLHHQGGLMMEAARISGTSIKFNQPTRRNNPEDRNLHTRHRKNLKYRLQILCCKTCDIV
jgi:hypothetical protein